MNVNAYGSAGINSTPDYVDANIKKQFDQLTDTIRAILSKTTYTQQDADELAMAMKKLYELQKKGGFDNTMNDATLLLLALFKATGFDPSDTPPSYDLSLSILQHIRDKGISSGGKTKSMDDILEIIASKNFADATKNLGDSVLVFCAVGIWNIFGRSGKIS